MPLFRVSFDLSSHHTHVCVYQANVSQTARPLLKSGLSLFQGLHVFFSSLIGSIQSFIKVLLC
jgi:hypothetical protein